MTKEEIARNLKYIDQAYLEGKREGIEIAQNYVKDIQNKLEELWKEVEYKLGYYQ